MGWWVSAVQSLDHTYRPTNLNPHWLHSFHLSLLLHYISRFKGRWTCRCIKLPLLSFTHDRASRNALVFSLLQEGAPI